MYLTNEGWNNWMWSTVWAGLQMQAYAKLSPVLSLLWELKGVGCVSCALYNVLTLELGMLTAVSPVCSLQLLLMSQSVRGASRCSTERLCSVSQPWQGARAAGLPAGVTLHPTVSSSALHTALTLLRHCWLQGQICIQLTNSRKTAAELNCYSNEECTQKRRKVLGLARV